MRKFLSILFAACLIVTTICFGGCSKKSSYSTDEIISFNNKIKEFTKKYDTYESDMKDDEYKINPEVNRLIIETDHSLCSDFSVGSFYSAGYQVFQYDNKNDLETDKKHFIDKGYKAFEDRVLKAQDSFFEDASTNDLWSYTHLDVDYAKAKCSNTGREVVVGVMDTGVEYEHPMLSGRVIETDANFSASGDENSSNDDNGHGTGVAGVIVHSTPDNVKIKPYKILSATGYCTELNVIAACEYILSQRNKPDIINMSFGGYNFDENSIERDMCDKLVDAGITVVIAAGNDFLDVEYVTPADNEKSIIVGSYSSDMTSSYFSNFGKGIDISAPGDLIYTSYIGSNYSTASGTSFSAPFVSAGCAYIKMLHPDYTVD